MTENIEPLDGRQVVEDRVVERKNMRIISNYESEYTTFMGCRFETDTLMESLGLVADCYNSVLRYDDYVIFVAINCDGKYLVALYEIMENPDDFEAGIIECQISLSEYADEMFEDSGHAVLWALNRVTALKRI